MAPILIQTVQPNDVLRLQEISRSTFFETFAKDNSEENMRYYLENNFSIEQLQKELNDPYSLFYFALEGPQVIGYLKINTGPHQTELKDENTIEIERIYVLQQYHGKNVGQLLLQQSFAVAQQQQVDTIWLGVWEHNPRAIRFYEKNGFTPFGKHDFLLGDDLQIDVLMKLKM